MCRFAGNYDLQVTMKVPDKIGESSWNGTLRVDYAWMAQVQSSQNIAKFCFFLKLQQLQFLFLFQIEKILTEHNRRICCLSLQGNLVWILWFIFSLGCFAESYWFRSIRRALINIPLRSMLINSRRDTIINSQQAQSGISFKVTSTGTRKLTTRDFNMLVYNHLANRFRNWANPIPKLMTRWRGTPAVMPICSSKKFIILTQNIMNNCLEI